MYTHWKIQHSKDYSFLFIDMQDRLTAIKNCSKISFVDIPDFVIEPTWEKNEIIIAKIIFE